MALKKATHPEEPPKEASRRTHGGRPSPSAAVGKRVCVGAVAGAHGVRGAVKIKSFTATPEDVAGYGPLEDESGERRFLLRLVGTGKGGGIRHLSRVAARNPAQAARGFRL